MVKRDMTQYCGNVCVLCQLSLLHCELLSIFPNIEFMWFRSYDLLAVRCLLLPKKIKTHSSGLERMGSLTHNLNRDIYF